MCLRRWCGQRGNFGLQRFQSIEIAAAVKDRWGEQACVIGPIAEMPFCLRRPA
jgi:hypothetical protein